MKPAGRKLSKAHRLRLARAQVEEERVPTCESCDQLLDIEHDGKAPHCWRCASYWADVSAGLFERYFEEEMYGAHR